MLSLDSAAKSQGLRDFLALAVLLPIAKIRAYFVAFATLALEELAAITRNYSAILVAVQVARLGEPDMAEVVIALFVAILLAGAILPTAFSQIFGANTSGWSTSTVTIWQLIPLFGALALVLLLIAVALGKRSA